MDIDTLRADTPSCRSYAHLDNAGASPMAEPVHQAMLRHLELEDMPCRRGRHGHPWILRHRGRWTC